MTATIRFKEHGQIIASGEVGQLVQEFEGHWYFAPKAVNMAYLRFTDRTYTCSYKGTCFWIDLEAPDAHVTNIGWVYQNPKPGYEFIKDQIGFYVRDTSATVAVQEPD